MPFADSARTLAALAFATTLTACAGSSHLMADAPPPVQPLAPAPNVATVVFMRPSGFGFAINFTIVDQSGRFVGEAVAESHFAVTVPPGEYLFIADAENTDVVHANLAPGLIYYVSVAAQMGALSAGVNMDPVKPSEEEWRKIPEYLSQSKRLISMLSAGQGELNTDPSKLRKMVDDGKRKWAEYSPAEKALHAIELGDGAGPRPVPPPVQYQASPPPPGVQYQPAAAPPPAPPAQPGPAPAAPPQYAPAPTGPGT